MAPSSLVVGCPPGVFLRHLAPYWFSAPASPFPRPRGVQCRSDGPVSRVVRLPQAFAPLQSLSQDFPPRNRSPLAALSRGFSPLQRYRSVRSHLPRLCLDRVSLRPRTYHVPRRFAPRTVSPVSFNRVRSWGSALQRLTRQESSSPLGVTFPSCDWLHPAPSRFVPKNSAFPAGTPLP